MPDSHSAPAGRTGAGITGRAALEGALREYLAMLYSHTTHPELAVYFARARKARAEALRQALPVLGRALARAVRRGRVALVRQRLRRQTQAELSALPDKVLNDIGILRGDIPIVARSMADKALQADRTAHRETEASAAPARPALEVIAGGQAGQAVAASVSEERLRGCG